MRNEGVRLESVTVRYGSGAASAYAIRGISASLEMGAVSVIMGPSGSGKTTMLSAIAGLLRPESGTVDVLGTRVSQMSLGRSAQFRRCNVGFVFQAFRLFRALTAIDNVLVAMRIAGRPADRTLAMAALDAMGMAGKSYARVWEMSGGEKQRVAIARALIHEPKLLLADEPTASLDAESIHAIGAILRRQAWAYGRLVVVVTHDPRLTPFADRVLRMQDGQLVEGMES